MRDSVHTKRSTKLLRKPTNPAREVLRLQTYTAAILTEQILPRRQQQRRKHQADGTSDVWVSEGGCDVGAGPGAARVGLFVGRDAAGTLAAGAAVPSESKLERETEVSPVPSTNEPCEAVQEKKNGGITGTCDDCIKSCILTSKSATGFLFSDHNVHSKLLGIRSNRGLRINRTSLL